MANFLQVKQFETSQSSITKVWKVSKREDMNMASTFWLIATFLGLVSAGLVEHPSNDNSKYLFISHQSKLQKIDTTKTKVICISYTLKSPTIWLRLGRPGVDAWSCDILRGGRLTNQNVHATTQTYQT